MSTFLNRLREHFTDVLHIFRNELVKVVKDEGVLMFLVVVPLGYPLLYSWIYNNETLHETPVLPHPVGLLRARQPRRAGYGQRLLRHVADACLQGCLSDCRG